MSTDSLLILSLTLILQLSFLVILLFHSLLPLPNHPAAAPTTKAMTRCKEETGMPARNGQDGADPLPPRVSSDRGREAAALLEQFAWLPEEEQPWQSCSSASMASTDRVDHAAVDESSSSHASLREDKSPPQDMPEPKWAAQTPAILQASPPEPTLRNVFLSVQSSTSMFNINDMENRLRGE